MNCSVILQGENRSFLSGNFGASVFLATYIGFYGIGLIIYFMCQFMNDSRDHYEDEIPSEFFTTFHHINERQNIYNQLIKKDWVRDVYKIYYADQLMQADLIEEKVEHCLKKYHKKMENLKSRYTYYITEIPTSPTFTTISCVD